MIKLDSVTISAGPINATFKPTDEERDAAWKILVDLGTSIATQPFLDESGHLRDVLSSLHRIFNSTKLVLKDLRPSKFDSDMNFASVCMALLTECLGPFLARWHEPLADFEASREETTSERTHELQWAKRNECIADLRNLQNTMLAFTQLLSELAGVRICRGEHD
ncbi:hypothetical protein [Ruegeria sp. YS9]|uniref:hypothetical protein n=1 Tax=Ruegeria sp. YS9 TaxID=2966453 RepID=UPI00214BB078|nr:hypothetical protein [Ruegeria sp. YS9]UUV08761.1 hypothetical protein NOR97_21050 [Ruegeria sp. YS9]